MIPPASQAWYSMAADAGRKAQCKLQTFISESSFHHEECCPGFWRRAVCPSIGNSPRISRALEMGAPSPWVIITPPRGVHHHWMKEPMAAGRKISYSHVRIPSEMSVCLLWEKCPGVHEFLHGCRCGPGRLSFLGVFSLLASAQAAHGLCWHRLDGKSSIMVPFAQRVSMWFLGLLLPCLFAEYMSVPLTLRSRL